MRLILLLLFSFLLAPIASAQDGNYPKDGNGLLDYCAAVVNAVDDPDSLTGKSQDRNWGKFNWCVGYIQATMDDMDAVKINLALFAIAGVRLSGPEKAQQGFIDAMDFTSMPQIPVSQVARVLVKWLRNHPERLHEPRSILMRAALKEAFPRSAPVPTKEPAESPSVKP